MITENTLRTKIEVAADGQLKATLDGVAQSVEKIDKAQQAQAESASAAASAGQANAAATQAVGESAAEAEARIKAMVQASLERQRTEQAQITASMRSVDTTKVATQTINEQVAAHQKAIAAADAYRERSAAASKAAGNTAGLDAQREAMHKLLGEIDPTVTSLDKLDKQQAKLAGFKKAGLLSDDDFTRFSQAIDGSRNRITMAGEAMSHFGVNTSQTRRELGYLVKDLATGQYGRLSQTSLTLAANTGIMGTAFSGAGVAVAGVTALLAAYAVGTGEAYLNEQKLNQAVAQTGNFAGVTMGEVNGLASGLGNATGKAGLARDILLALSADGKVGRESFAALGQAAFDMAQLTGKSAGEAASAVTQMFDGTVTGALKANEQYHFLTDATYDHIKALEEEGRAQEAAQVAAEAFHDAVGPRIAEMESQVYGLAKAWDSVAASTRGWWEEFKTGSALIAGTADITTQYYAQLGRVQGEIEHFGSASFGQQEKLDQLKKQMDAAIARTDQQAAQTRLNNDAVTGDATIDRLSASVDKADAKKQKLAELSAAFDKLWGSADPGNARLAGVQRLVGADGSVSFSGGAYDKLRADIEKKYAPPKGPKNPETNAYATFANQVDALGIKNITADDAAVTKYEQGIAKLAEDMANYMAKGGDATKAAAEFNRGQQALQQTLDANHARELTAQAEYAAALDKSNVALQQQVNNEIARIGMGDKEYQRSQAITKAYQDEADALEKLSLKRQAGINGESGGLSQASYDADVKALRAATAEKVSIMQDGYRRMDEAQGDWLSGTRSALQNYVDAARDVADTVRDGFAGMFGNMEDAGVDWLTGSELNMKSLEKDFERMLARMLIRALEAQAMSALLGAIGGSYGAASTNTFSSIGTDSSGGSINFVSQVGGRAGGGRIDGPGTGTSDSILARVSNGENVITASTTDYYGQSFMDALNAKQVPRFADGGRVGGGAAGGMAGTDAGGVVVNIYGAENGARTEQRDGADGRKYLDIFINAAAQDVARGGRLGQAIQAATGTRRPARSYAAAGG